MTDLICNIVPYTDEDDNPDPAKDGFVMLEMDGNNYLDNIPADEAKVIRDFINNQAQKIEGLIEDNCRLSRTYQAARANIRALED